MCVGGCLNNLSTQTLLSTETTVGEHDPPKARSQTAALPSLDRRRFHLEFDVGNRREGRVRELLRDMKERLRRRSRAVGSQALV